MKLKSDDRHVRYYWRTFVDDDLEMECCGGHVKLGREGDGHEEEDGEASPTKAVNIPVEEEHEELSGELHDRPPVRSAATGP